MKNYIISPNMTDKSSIGDIFPGFLISPDYLLIQIRDLCRMNTLLNLDEMWYLCGFYGSL